MLKWEKKWDHVQCPCLVNDSDLHDEFKMSKHGEMQWSLVSNPSWPGSVAGWNLPRSCWRNDPVMTSRHEHGNFVPKREESFGRPSWPTKTTYYLNSWTTCKCFFWSPNLQLTMLESSLGLPRSFPSQICQGKRMTLEGPSNGCDTTRKETGPVLFSSPRFSEHDFSATAVKLIDEHVEKVG